MSDTRTALARLHRPRRFAEMATQEHVSETLRAAVARGRVAHAYLFAGPRGVGKTTAARVLAMALNCPNRTPEGEPCGHCEVCERIWSGRTSLDVVEIDAASNRGVDDARDLRERAMYAPAGDRGYKVYIIDEAHMLTREAWNALLKILEEPPPRVIFIFATTEPQKIQQAAPPILSRCQRFDFRRISVTGIVDRLKVVLEAEGARVPDEALVTIARRAEGGMRDALSLLDQVLSFADESVSADDVRRVLGLTGEELYLELFDILAERRHGDVFRFVQRLVDEGYDLAEFYRGLADALRALLVSRLEGAGEADVRDDLRAGFAAAAERFATGDLLRMLAQVAELDTDGRFRKNTSPRLLLEALLLRFAHLDRTIELEQLIRAAGGEEGGQPETVPPRAPEPPPEAQTRARPQPRTRTAAPAAGRPRERPREAAGLDDSTPAGGARAHDPAPDVVPPRERAHDRAPGAGPPPMEWGDIEASRRAPQPTDSLPPAQDAGPPNPLEPPEPPTPASRTTRSAAPASAAVAPELTSSVVEAALRSLVASGKSLPPGLGIFLKAAQVGELAGDRLVLDLPQGPGLERLTSEPVTLRSVEDALADRLGHRLVLEVRPLGRASGRAGAPSRLTPERVKAARLERMARDEPLLGRVVEEWDLELMD